MSEQKDKCPECIGRGKIYNLVERVLRKCPTCNGTGEKKLDRPDREKIAEKLYQQRWYESQPTWEKSLIKELFRNYADQILALFPKEGK